ncbi:hypothetical protein [Pseudoxanthomonas mexicana]
MHALAPLILALSGLPALLIGAWVSRAGDPRSRGMAVHWVLIGLAIQAGAVGLYWAGDDDRLAQGSVIAMVVLVNALIVSMVLQLRRHGKRQ